MSKRRGLETISCGECGTEFNQKSWNQAYCSPPCAKKATNEKIMKNYYGKKNEKKDRAAGNVVCSSSDCGTILSQYNTDDICASCARKEFVDSWPMTDKVAHIFRS